MSTEGGGPRVPRDGGAAPRIVIQNGEYWLLNKGDLAMLDVTVKRLRQRWPDARIGVLTSAPLLFRAFHPGLDPIRVVGPGGWPRTGFIGHIAERVGPRLCGPPTIS